MTSPVNSFSQTQGLSDPIGSAGGPPTGTPPGGSSPSPSLGKPAGSDIPSGEAVTLTPDAQTSTDLLEAARTASGVDLQAVQSLKTEIASGTYQIPPETLAASIVAALTETR